MGIKAPGILLVLLLYQDIQVYCGYVADLSDFREALLSSYDTAIRPANKTEVLVGLTLLSIKDLNSEEQILKAAGFFTVVWNESQITWDSSSQKVGDLDRINFQAGELWRPELVILNSVHTIGVLTESDLQYTIINRDAGTVAWEPPAYFEVYCELDLTFFPFDKHKCGIVVSGWTMTDTEMPVHSLVSFVNLDLYKSNSEWNLVETSVEESKRVSWIGSQSFSYSKVTFYLTLHRQTQYYGLSMILPLLLVSLLSTLVFILPAEGGEKASYSVFLLVAFFVVTGTILGFTPVSSKTTVIATYMTLILFIIASSTLCASIVINIHYSDAGQPMSAASKRISNFLLLLACKNLMGDSDKDILGEELESSETTSTNLTNSMNKSNGSLHTKEHWQAHAFPPRQLPPVDTIYKRNQIRPKSESSVKTMKTEGLSVRELNAQILKELADSLDRLFFIMFLVITLLVNFILIIVLAVGQS